MDNKVTTGYSFMWLQCWLLLSGVTMYCYHMWYAKNRSHKLTAGFSVYFTYKVRKTWLLHAAVVSSYYVIYAGDYKLLL